MASFSSMCIHRVTLYNKSTARYFRILLVLLFPFFMPTILHAQNDSTLVKYSRDFKLKDGIYQTFKEFKNNKPSLPEFEVIKDKIYGEDGSMILRYPCPDSIGSKKTCEIEDCFGFCKNGIFENWKLI